ncbi:hypothetical protein ONE63_009443 [Megalurothrips usitatus]|uniref:Nuclear pore complex protein Nup155 n=1 Tax=Megalurothrips usitatus TaxID=439358 RepID=A0AAV7XS51_9NEOP|nr:hypothetical protein ONE63_009443 [Megalurothrips usitatus]
MNLTGSVMDRTGQLDQYRTYIDSLDIAGKMIELQINKDSNFPTLVSMMRLSAESGATVSGMNDSDYPSLNNLSGGLADLKLLRSQFQFPLPREVMEHFSHMQCHCMMGLFTDIHRAWLTIDSDIYVWSYEHGSDVAYYDALGETILCVGLIRPKPGVFKSFIRYLLILATTIDIVILGVTFSSTADGQHEEMHVILEPVFSVPTDGMIATTIVGTDCGRIFIGGRDGNLYEIVYQAEGGWFSKRCRKVNHSVGTLSYIVPSFLSAAFAEEDSISQIVVDSSRHVLYTLSNKGTIAVFDMGADGQSMSRTTALSQASVVQHAIKIVNKTLDSNNFRPIVSISAIQSKESTHLNLVGVTQTGARLYFTTGCVSRAVRPYTLNLLHVRLPPGYAANAPSHRPAKVHMATYNKGNTILITSGGGECDTLWSLSSDPYPFHPYLVEVQTVLNLNGRVWALAEVGGELPIGPAASGQAAIESDASGATQSDSILDHPDPPLVVRQHIEPPRKYIVLTPQGTEIFNKLRPVDILRQIMTERGGPENDAVKTFFEVQSEEQACATCLILACLESTQNAQLAEWATRAFFLYGGEPRTGVAARPNIAASPYPYSVAGNFNPNVVSTPVAHNAAHGSMGGVSMGISNQGASDGHLMTYSAKHNGLYLYVSRILRPIWSQKVTQRITADNRKNFLVSAVSGEDCVWVLSHLHALRAFLERNTQLAMLNSSSSQLQNSLSMSRHVDPLDTPAPNRIGVPHTALQEAQLEEKRSLDALKTFLAHTCEVLGLWKVLSDHQFHNLAQGLLPDDQSQLSVMTFRDLILVGQHLCSALITSLINSYLSDNASVDSVSAKLREICPKLYRNEDAACNKANEMLIKAKAENNVDEKERLLQRALQLCKEVSPNLNLAAACSKFYSAQWYEGVLQLCVAFATKLDPKDVAVHYYRNGEPNEDTEGCQAFMARMDAYKELVGVLDQLYGQSRSHNTSVVPLSPGPPALRDSAPSAPTDSQAQAKKLIDLALRCDDELCHVAIYEWMLRRGLEGELLAGSNIYRGLEAFLARAARSRPDSIEVNDLLWKFHERNGNHAAAAKILYQLASKPRALIHLKQRVDYLAHAIMCMRSDKVGAAPNLGVFLRELEDQMEVARIQQKILDAISNLRSQHPQPEAVETAIVRLNTNLYDMTQLYQDYAEPFDLWECKLAIIHVSGYTDPTLIENIWLNIISTEMNRRNTQDRLSALMDKVKTLGREYSLASRSFPIALLVKALEVEVCSAKADPSIVHTTMLSTGVPLPVLLDVYEKMIAANDRCFLERGNDFHLIQAVSIMVNSFTNTPTMVSVSERRAVVAKSGDVISICLNTLYSKPGTQDLIEKLRGIQAKLNRLGM